MGRGTESRSSSISAICGRISSSTTCLRLCGLWPESVCSGSFILQAAGLLDGRSATTHWKAIGALRALGVDVVEERFVHDGPVWSSGGVSAGIDMTLAFIADQAGEQAAYETQMNAEYFPDGRRYGHPETHPQVPLYVKRP